MPVPTNSQWLTSILATGSLAVPRLYDNVPPLCRGHRRNSIFARAQARPELSRTQGRLDSELPVFRCLRVRVLPSLTRHYPPSGIAVFRTAVPSSAFLRLVTAHQQQQVCHSSAILVSRTESREIPASCGF